MNDHGKTEPLLSVAANSVGIELEELLQHLPSESPHSFVLGSNDIPVHVSLVSAELTMWVNPGEVSYRLGEHGPLQFLYNAQEGSNSTLNKLISSGPATGSDSQLRLSLDSAAGSNWLVSSGTGTASPVFELSTPNDMKFTIGSFAMTRFGTTKQKSNLAVLKQIQRKAAASTAGKSIVNNNNGESNCWSKVPSSRCFI